jgi:proliferating cell nuclear antigen
MLVKLDAPLMLSKAVEIISDLVTEVRVKVNEFGMSITAMDPANVAMVGFRLPRSAFSQYESGTETLGVNLDSLKRILKRCGTKSSLVLESKENVLEIQIYDKIKRKFSLALIEVESEDKEMPSLDYSSKVDINSMDLVDSIEDCVVVSDSCSFVVEDGKFVIEAKSLNSARSEFSGDDVRIEAENCKSKYSLEYLQKFAKGMKLSEKTILRFANDHPLKVEIRANSMELDFVLAPRVEIDD